MSAHTPGPWILGNEDEQCCDVECGGGRASISLNRFDSLMRDEFHISRAEMLANAHLVAAAPELLATLRALVDQSEREPNWSLDDDIAKARAAIKKAEGK